MFDKIAIPRCFSGKEFSDIADKYFEYRNLCVAFEFDQRAVDKNLSLAPDLADKWYDRSKKRLSSQ